MGSARITRRQLLAGGAALLAATTGLSRARAATRTTAIEEALDSAALASPLRFVVHLPAGYSAAGSRYPVVYFLHGLPASPTAYLSLDWVAEALAQTGRKAIVVTPQGTHVAGGDPEYHDWGVGRNWETAIGAELPAWIDARYPTLAHRSGRAIAGLSAGGYGASIIGLRRPETFSVIQSWSGYFEPTDPSGKEPLEIATTEAAKTNVQSLVPRLRTQFARYPTRFSFYVGSSDPVFVPANVSLHHALAAAGVDHVFRLYPGGHTTALWQAHASAWLASAIDDTERR